MVMLHGTVELSRYWWTFILRGVLAILFGIVAFVSPPTTIAVLVILFGAWALVDGGFHIAGAIRGRSRDRSFWLAILEGAVSIIAGLIALVFPGLAAAAILLLISAWSIITGVIEVALAIRLRERGATRGRVVEHECTFVHFGQETRVDESIRDGTRSNEDERDSSHRSRMV